MTHITSRLDAATEARLRQAAAFFAKRADDPAIGMGVLHPVLFPAELHA